MKPAQRVLQRALLLLLFAVTFVVGCHRQPGENKGRVTRVNINVVTTGGVRHAYMSSDYFHVGRKTDFTFQTDGCKFTFDKPSSDPDGLFDPNQTFPSGTNVTVRIGDIPGTYTLKAQCDGIPIEGHSPPIIIVDQ